MDSNHTKRTLFTAWISAGPITVYFDSGHPEVRTHERLRNDPEAWVVLGSARISPDGLAAQVKPPDAEAFEIYIPWTAVHTYESEVLHEVHVWGADVAAADSRKESRRAGGLRN